MVSAAKTAFSHSEHLFCMVHVKDNVRQHLAVCTQSPQPKFDRTTPGINRTYCGLAVCAVCFYYNPINLVNNWNRPAVSVGIEVRHCPPTSTVALPRDVNVCATAQPVKNNRLAISSSSSSRA